MENVRFRPLVQFLGRLNDLGPGDTKYRLDGPSEKTLHRWFDLNGEPDLNTVQAIGRGCAKWFEGGRNASIKGAVYEEIHYMDPTARAHAWTSDVDWARWFKWLWEQCQKPLDFRIWDDARKDYSSALLPPRLPVPGGTKFQIRLYFERPAWYLLVWLSGAGQSAPLGEGTAGTKNNWQDWNRFKFFHLLGERVLPLSNPQPWTLSDEAAAETIILLACQEEREPDALLKDRIRGAFAQLTATLRIPGKGKVKSPSVGISAVQLGRLEEIILCDLRRAQRSTRDSRALPILDAAVADADPLQVWHDHLRTELTPWFDRTVILSFANSGTKDEKR